MEEELKIKRIKIFSDILQDIAQVLFASMFVGPLISGTLDASMIYFGAVLSVVIWISSVLLIRR